MKKGLVSVIVPVYNAEKHIRNCYGYISEQSYKNWEVIFVNDGSTDQTESICRELSKNNDSVYYYAKDNGGPASARNVGISHANGEYLYFMDVDDILHANALEILEKAYRIQDVDFVIGNTLRIDIYGNKKKEWNEGDLLFSNREGIKQLVERYANDIKSNKILWSAWGKLYKSSIVKSNKVLFDEHVYAWEDVLFVFSYLTYCNSCYILKECLYTYIHYGQENIASGRSYLGPMDYKYTVSKISNILCENKFKSVINNCYSEYAIWSMFNVIRLMPRNQQHYYRKIYMNIHRIVTDKVLQESIYSYIQKHDDNARIIPFLIKHKMSIAIIIVFKLQIKYKLKRGKK